MTVSDLVTLLGKWDAGKGPLYRKLSAGIERLLEQGQISTGASLPPERSLAAALAVSRNTVSAAYAELRSGGWVDARQGSATTVTAAGYSPVGAYRANGMFATLLRNHPDVIDLTVAVPDPAPIVRDILAAPTAHLTDPETLWRGHGYHPGGHPLLRAKLAELLTTRGLRTSDEEVLITTGAQQAISLVIRALTRTGDAVAVEEVSFPGALDAISHAGADAVPVRMGPTGIDVEDLSHVLRAKHPRMLYVIPTFHNPTGLLLEPVERKRLARLIAETGTTTVDDLTLAELDFGTPAPPPLAAIEADAPIITVGSLSKVFWGGLRVGWIRANSTVISHLAGVKATADLGSSAPIQVLATALLEHYEDTRAWRKDSLCRSLLACTDALGSLLPDWRWTLPQGGPHLWVEIPDTDATAFSQRMLRNGVAVVAGPLLAVSDGVATSHIRIPYYRSPAALEDAVERFAAIWPARA